jgi:GTP pyrophosphokinase
MEGSIAELADVAPENPARALIPPPNAEVDQIIATLSPRSSEQDLDLVRRAHACATKAHEGQFRLSGEPYITHPVAVATIVADLGLDAVSAAAALLHDAVEDTGIDLGLIALDFGPAVAAIVDGVTKLDRLRFDSREAQQAATMRKMLLAMANDWRVLVIKLADRLHNMRTLTAPDRRGNARHLCTACTSSGYPGSQVAAGGSRIRDAASQAFC